MRFSAGMTSGIEYCSASASNILLLLLLETDFVKGPTTFWAVAHEDGFQRGYLHVLIDLGNLDAPPPGVEIAGDVPLVPVDRNTVENLVELVSHRFLQRVNIASKQFDKDFLVTVFASCPVAGNETPELATQYVVESWHSESHNEPRLKYSIKNSSCQPNLEKYTLIMLRPVGNSVYWQK